MNTIDERVVEMRFDNKQFTAETKNTLSMLERLKAALQFSNSGKEIDKMARSVSSIRFDGIAAGVEALTNRFSTFGIVGMRVIENVTDGLMGKLVGAVNYAKNAIVSGGIKRAMNIENAHFQLQALLKDEAKVQAVMANANESVDGTAYAYDEAAKAAAMFAASGIEAGDEMLGALKGITGVAAMTNAEFSAISMIFTTVAGNGRLMGDQLLQLSSRGLNAASTLTDYFKEVEHQAGMTETKVRDMVSKGQISFKTFAAAMNWAFGDSAKRANETFTGAMSNMRSALARIGAGFVSPLIEQNGVLVDMFNALRITFNEVKGTLVFDQATSSVEGFGRALGMTSEEAEKFYSKVEKKGYVTLKNLKSIQKNGKDGYSQLRDYFNGITDGSIRASYSVTKVVDDLAKGNKVTRQDIRKFVKEGKVDFSIFSNAMEEAFGSQKQKLSKRFTDFAIKNLDDLRETIEGLDIQKGMDIAYKGFDSIVNIVKALAGVIKPVATSFANVFLGFDSNDIMEAAVSIEQFTKKLTVSEESADKLQRTFTGVFDIIALLGDGLIELVRAFIPFGSNVKDGSDSLLDLSANLGDNLSKFAQWVRTNPKVLKAFARLRYNVRQASEWIRNAGEAISEFVTNVRENETVQKVVTKTGEIFTSVGDGIYDTVRALIEAFKQLHVQFYMIDFSSPMAALGGLRMAFEALTATLMQNEGFAAIVIHLREMGEEAQRVFSTGNLEDKINFIKGLFQSLLDVLKEVVSFIKERVIPLFNDISIGGVAATGIGFGMTVSSINIAKSIETLATSMGAIPQTVKSVSGVLTSLKGTLGAYQKDLKADALLKIAGAIGILAGSLVLLTLVDTKRLVAAGIALTAIGTVIAGIISKLGSLKNDATSFTVLDTFARGLTRSVNNLAKAVKWKAIGSAIKDLGITLGIVAAAVAGIAFLYSKDPASVKAAFEFVKEMLKGLGEIVIAMIAVGSIFKKGAKSFALIAAGTALLAFAMLNIVSALNKLFSMEFPYDYKKRLAMFKGLLAEMAALTVVIGLSSRLAGTGKLSAVSILAVAALLSTTVKSLQKLFKMKVPVNWPERLAIFGAIFAAMAALILEIGVASAISKDGGKVSFGTILALSAFLFTAVQSLKTLFKMKLPEDWPVRFAMFEALFISLGAIMVAISLANKDSKQAIKGTAAILAMCAFLGTAVMSLMVLSLIPGDALIKGAAALGIILLSLAATMAGVGKVTDASAAKAVMSMAAMVGVVTAALGVLSLMSIGALVKSCAALGSILLALSLDFATAGKMSDSKAFAGVVAMMGALITITGLLVILAGQPWEGMLAAGAALSAVMVAFAKMMKTISGASGIKMEKIQAFVLASLAVIPLGLSLAILANQPWEGILAAGVALSATILAFANMMKMISAARGIKMEKIQTFLLASLALVPIGAALGILAHQPWDGMLAAGAGLSAVLLSYSLAFTMLSMAPTPNLASIGAFLLACVALLPIGVALGVLANQPWLGMLAAGQALSQVLLAMSATMVVVTVVGAAAPAAMAGIGALMVFIAAVTGLALAAASLNKIPGIQEFVSGGGDLLQKIGEALGKFVAGIGVGIASGLPQIGAYLNLFAMQMAMIPKAAGEGALIVARMLLALTGASLISGLTNLLPFTKSFKEMGEELVEFGGYIAKFGKKVEGINPASVAAAAAAGQMIARLYEALPKSGGWMQQILGESMSLAEFGAQLLAFGPPIAAFSVIVKDVKKEAVEGAAAAAGLIAEIYNKLPKSGGWMQQILGESMSLQEFGRQLLLFGPSIAAFAFIVKDVKKEAVEGAAAAATLITELYDKLPRTGGWAQAIFGEQTDLSGFGQQLDDFGEAIVNFAEKVKDVNSTSVEGAAAAAGLIANLYEKLPQEDGWLTNIFGGGETDLSEFGTELGYFGEAITVFAEKVKDVKSSDVEGAVKVTTAMADLSDILPKEGNMPYASFGKQLESLGGSLYTFYYNIVNLDVSKISSLSTALKKLIDTANDAGKDVATKFAEAVESHTKQATEAVNNLLANVLSKITKAKPIFKKNGGKIAQEFVDGIKSYNKNTGVNVIQANAELLAKYYAQGFANGIEDNLHIATKAAAKMARKADEAVANVLEEHSPSKVAEQRGKWYNEGLVIGIEKSADLPVKAAAEVATDVTEATDKNLNVSKTVDKTAEQVTEGVKKVAKALRPMSEHFKEVSASIETQMSGVTKAVAKSYKEIDKMQRTIDKAAKKKEKEDKKNQKYEDYYNKQVENRVKWLSMSAEERKKQAAEDAKAAKIQVEAEEYAYKKTQEKWKKDQNRETTSSAIKFRNKYYENLHKVITSGNNKILYADKSLEEAEADIWKRITDVMRNYTEKWASTRDEIMSQVNFFDEMSEGETKTSDQLLQNAASQVDGYQRYINVQQSLAKRLKGTELADYIAEQGIDQVDQLEVINQMTDEQLTKYAELYSQKLDLAGVAAKKQLKQFRKDVKTELKNILPGLFDDMTLDEFAKLYEKGIEAIFSGSRDEEPKKKKKKKDSDSEETESAKKGPGYDLGVQIGQNIMLGQKKTVKKSQTDISKGIGTAISKTTKENKSKAKSSGKSIGKAGADGMKSTKSMYYSAGKSIGKTGADGMKSTKSMYYSAGLDAGNSLAEGLRSQAGAIRNIAGILAEYATDGFMEGIERSQMTIRLSGEKIGDDLVFGVTNSLSIHSPSLVMKNLGDFATLGFVGGLLQHLALVTKASKEISDAATDSIKPDIPRFFDDLDFNPVIAPVVDMSNVNRSINDIQSMFNRSIGVVSANVEATAGTMNLRTKRVDTEEDSYKKPNKDVSKSYVFNQYNQSPKALSSIDIYRNTKNQFAQFREAVDKT